MDAIFENTAAEPQAVATNENLSAFSANAESYGRYFDSGLDVSVLYPRRGDNAF